MKSVRRMTMNSASKTAPCPDCNGQGRGAEILWEREISSLSAGELHCSPRTKPAAERLRYESHCGADPVYHHATQSDPLGLKPLSGFCARQKGVMGTVLDLLDHSPEDAAVLRQWGAM